MSADVLTGAGEVMEPIGRAALAASEILSLASTAQKNAALTAAAKAVRDQATQILEANAKDMAAARERNLSAAMLDRLQLDAKRVAGIARAIEEVVGLADPIGTVSAEWE